MRGRQGWKRVPGQIEWGNDYGVCRESRACVYGWVEGVHAMTRLRRCSHGDAVAAEFCMVGRFVGGVEAVLSASAQQ